MLVTSLLAQKLSTTFTDTEMNILVKYHPTSALMQILHFDWLLYYRSISNSHRVVKFAGFVNLFISFYYQINIFFAEFIIAFFCLTCWVILKQLDPSSSRATDQ